MATHALLQIDKTLQSAVDQWNTVVLTHFHNRVRAKIAEKVREGQDQFGVQVDGKAATYARIDQARKIVRVQFTQTALTVALDVAMAKLSEAINETTTTRTGRLKSRLAAWYSRSGSPWAKVPNIKAYEFQAGDTVAFVVEMPYGPVVNRHVSQNTARRKTEARDARRRAKGKSVLTTKSRGQGFMALAAKKINLELGQRKGLGGISVTAGFSRALQEAGGYKVFGKPKNQRGVAAIFVTLRYLTRANVINLGQ